MIASTNALNCRARPLARPQRRSVVVRADLLKKPAARPTSESGALAVKPEMPVAEAPKKLFGESAPGAPVAAPSAALSAASGTVTIEYQRMRAKEMIAYFREVKATENIAKQGGFGWTVKNEISNGRWVMFGWAVGLLTEYATGVDFPHQFLLIVQYLGIADIE